jgi:hypothetical protein
MPVELSPISSSGGWVAVQEADIYFGTRHGIGTKWSGLSITAKTALLTTAQQAIESSADYTFPDAGEETQAMKDAVCEQVFFILLDPDAELRQALQAQGVIEAGIVEEKYRESVGGEVIIAPRAKALLKSLLNDNNHAIPWVR